MPFIVFEGLDGAGLTTQSQLLKKRLEGLGYRVYLTKEPTDGIVGSIIRAYLRREIFFDRSALPLLFATDRVIHSKKIEKLLKSGVVVISDRYKLSSFAYQFEFGVEWIKTINKKAIDPDITFVLDVPPSVALERIKRSRFYLEAFENIETLEKVRENYLKLAREFPNTYVVDANRRIEDVSRDVFEILKNSGLIKIG